MPFALTTSANVLAARRVEVRVPPLAPRPPARPARHPRPTVDKRHLPNRRPLTRSAPLSTSQASLTAARSSSRRAARFVPRASDEDVARDSSGYRAGETEGTGLLGKIVSNLPDGRKETAPESYGSRPASKTLAEGRYRRPPPERVGGVTEQAVRGDDFEVVDGPSFGVGTAIGALVALATLGGVYLTVNKISEGPVVKESRRMPERDTAVLPRAAPAPAPAVAAE